MTVGVYGLVAGIVKIDDAGLYLSKRANGGAQALCIRSAFLLWMAPYFMKFLSIAGTAAMFLVGGHILVEGIPFLHHLGVDFGKIEGIGWLVSMLFDAAVGIVAGVIVVAVVTVVSRLRKPKPIKTG